MAVDILLHGCNGHMGRVISEILRDPADTRVVCGVDINTSKNFDYPVFGSFSDIDIPFDVIIDFSHIDAVRGMLDHAASVNKPVVLATTGLTDDLREVYTALSSKVPVFVSANMSLGVNMMVRLTAQAASKLSDKFDIEIVEAHHRRKIDAPSGTALMIADAIKEACYDDKHYVFDRQSERRPRSSDEIGIYSIRGGTIPGEHTVIFAGDEEILEITHKAQSRSIFARGAIAAARFICGLPAGLYSMDDLLKDG